MTELSAYGQERRDEVAGMHAQGEVRARLVARPAHARELENRRLTLQSEACLHEGEIDTRENGEVVDREHRVVEGRAGRDADRGRGLLAGPRARGATAAEWQRDPQKQA